MLYSHDFQTQHCYGFLLTHRPQLFHLCGYFFLISLTS
jgi:hypothetical protein